MKTIYHTWRIVALLFSVLPLTALAQQAPTHVVKDHTTDPVHYFLREGETANSLTLLPAPPDTASAQFQYDIAQYEWGKSMRYTERGDQAAADAHVDGPHVPMSFSEPFGIDITEEETPEIYKLIVGMREDAGDLAAKNGLYPPTQNGHIRSLLRSAAAYAAL